MRRSVIATGAAFVVMAATAGYCLRAGVFYQTGAQFYETCWRKEHSRGDATSPTEAAQWTSCERAADAALHDEGIVPFEWRPDYAITPQLKALLGACPNREAVSMVWSDVVDGVEGDGGPKVQDGFLPAVSGVRRFLRARWPRCAEVARSNGFPPDGALSASCEPCQPANRLEDADAKRTGTTTFRQMLQRLSQSANTDKQ